MTNAPSREHGLDPEMTALVERFERAYAELSSDAEPEPERVPAAPQSLFPQEDYEFPEELDTLKVVRAGTPSRDHAPAGSAAGPPCAENTDDDQDIERAFAILRAGESKVPPAANVARHPPRADAAQHKSRRDLPAPVVRSKRLRHFAGPALAIAVFVGLAAGYLMTHNSDKPATGATASTSQATAMPGARLRLDYDLAKFKRGATVAESRNRPPGRY